MYDRKALALALERDEKRMMRLYLDPLGILTGGVGHAFGHVPVPEIARAALRAPGVMDKELSDDEVNLWLEQDIAAAERDVKHLAMLRNVDFDMLSDERQAVLMNMTFNLGSTRLGGFVQMWAALAARQYDEAARQMLDSKWAAQVGARAQRLADRMRRG